MKLEQSFTVAAPVEQVWSALIDVERIAPCLPGAEITGRDESGGYQGTFSVKLGPTTAAYRGSLRMEEVDEAARTATMSAKGTDKRGQGGATASIVSTMREEGDATHVEVVTDFTITGRLARFGRGGMIEDISKRLMRDFAQCLESTLGTEPAAAVATASEPEQAEAEVASAAEPPAAAAEPAPAAPLGGEEPVSAAEEPAPAAPLGGEEPVAAEEAAASAALPGEDAEPARRAGEADPWGPLSPPAEPVAPAEEEAPAPRTHSIPPPSARPAAPPAKPVKGFSLLFGVLWDRIKAFFGRLFGRGKKD